MMLSITVALALSAHSPAAQESEVRAKFVALAEKRDSAALIELWQAHRDEVLVTIDADLEGSLATWEASPDKPDAAAIAAQQERALWGARLATEALVEPIFHDYAAAFVGWNDAQKKSFRAGQAAYGRARKAAKAGDHAAAAKAGRECADLALPLGDWWGYAMGLSAEGQALLAAGDKERAVASLSQACAVYRDLGLVGDTIACAKATARALLDLGRTERALATVAVALNFIDLNDEAARAELQQLTRDIEAAREKR